MWRKKTKLKNALFFHRKCFYDTLILRISPPKLGREHAVVSGRWLYVRKGSNSATMNWSSDGQSVILSANDNKLVWGTSMQVPSVVFLQTRKLRRIMIAISPRILDSIAHTPYAIQTYLHTGRTAHKYHLFTFPQHSVVVRAIFDSNMHRIVERLGLRSRSHLWSSQHSPDPSSW